MTDPLIEHLDLASEDIVAERVARLREDFPEVFEDGVINFDALQRSLGKWVDPGKERFGLTWPGKAACMRTIQQPSTGTLRPDRAESVDFDTTQNVIIEGENLEVLKLLQKSYYGKVKMIYIDPPYNTGNDFIYSDDYRDPLGTYLRMTGQVDDEGVKLTTNPDTEGRFHSKWLNMMYPRLFLARNLLRDDGAIFVSIDDHEIHSLRMLLSEIFGEENFVATVIWQKVYAPKNTARHFSEDHDYVVVYARNGGVWLPELLPRSAEANARYLNPDNDPRGPWKPSDLTARNYYSKGQYEIVGPTGRVFTSGVGRYWRSSYEAFLEMDRNDEIWWGATGDNMPAQKRFLSAVKQGLVPQTLWTYSEVGHTQEAKQELLHTVEFTDTENVLNSVKPSRLIQRMVQAATSATKGDIVLDFFAGSGVMGHAVMQQNAADGGNRHYMSVQFPELLPKPDERMRTIADIARARFIAAGQRIAAERAGSLPLDGGAPLDLGFRAYTLAESNVYIKRGGGGGAESHDTPA
ncbi:MAG: site-specific DNA-methyltransferase, partial [Thermomicrobiales bacterium]